MMGSKGDYLENKLLDHVLGRVTYTPPTTVYVALFTTPVSDTGVGTEVSGGGYARVAVANTTASWTTAANGQKSNAVAITFPKATANWGTVVAWAIFDAATGGNCLYYGDVNPSIAVYVNAQPQFAAGSLTIIED
jgi:hypothetical protein